MRPVLTPSVHRLFFSSLVALRDRPPRALSLWSDRSGFAECCRAVKRQCRLISIIPLRKGVCPQAVILLKATAMPST